MGNEVCFVVYFEKYVDFIVYMDVVFDEIFFGCVVGEFVDFVV